MLILTRRTGEAILMDGDVRIVVLGIDSGGVRLGIEAPTSVGILREEVVQRIAEENIRAGAAGDPKELSKILSGADGSEGNAEPGEKSEQGEAEDGSREVGPED